MPLLSEIKFGSYLSYSPHGQTEIERQSRGTRDALKYERVNGNPPVPFSKFVISLLKNKLEQIPFKDFFGTQVALVPVPKSSLMMEGTLWIPSLISKEMASQGLGQYFPCLQRTTAVKKAAFSSYEDRPKVKDHIESIQCTVRPDIPTKIVLVDDIVTTGATLLGCANKLQQYYPQAQIYAFSVMRAINNPKEFQGTESPCIGAIKLVGENTHRRP